MIKAGIFIDTENLVRCGGWGMRYGVVRQLVEAQQATILRANAYMAYDKDREVTDPLYRKKKTEYRDSVRRESYHLTLKPVQRYTDAEGQTVTKANADLDLAVDALLQAENLDYVLLGSGDGDFLRLVRALQNRGKRVDLLAFSNVSQNLRAEVDNFFSGYLLPGLLPTADEARVRGFMHHVNEEKGYGFLTIQTGLKPEDRREDVFLHINDFSVDGNSIGNEAFARIKTKQDLLEFDLVENNSGRPQAVNATFFRPELFRPADLP